MSASVCRPIARSCFRRTAVLVNNGYIQRGLPTPTTQKSDTSQPHQSQCRRQIHHTTPLFHTQKTIKVRRTRGPEDYENDLPPPSNLKTAYKSGALPIAPENVLKFLRAFQTYNAKSTPGWQRTVCLEHDIDPWSLGIIAGILAKCETPGQRMFGKYLILTAASFEDRASVFQLVHEATKKGNLQNVAVPLEHVGLLAKKGNDPQAMTLLGMVLFSQDHEQEALPWLRKASAGPLDFPGAADALVLEGRILMSYDADGAAEAFQRAAEELDDPNAYFYLSQIEQRRNPGSTKYEEYLIKAATSGVVEACHNLGVIEMKKHKRIANSMDDYGMAAEWTEVAANGGYGPSMLNMALMCKAVGLREEAMDWLGKAGGQTNSAVDASDLRRRWESEDDSRNSQVS